ncbi:hypothetical protein PHYC_02526 [Phycisphaerales bacterium]|nr:hypothetical protein PHYC_02526 [Phycisphaerales bacterium]
MRVLPQTDPAQVLFFSLRVGAWAEDPAALGLLPEQVAELAEFTAAAKDAALAMAQARNAAEAATRSFHIACERMRGLGAPMIATIKARAQFDRSVYSKAMLFPPDAPTRSDKPPAPPRSLRADVRASGEIVLTWRGSGPTGTDHGPGARGGHGVQYAILRKSYAPDGTLLEPYRLIAVTGERRFEDAPLPAGQYAYAIRARRGDAESVTSSAVSVQIGAAEARRTARIAA